MATNTLGSTARYYPRQLVHYCRKTVNFNDPGIGVGSTVVLGVIPGGCRIIGLHVIVDTPFNAVTTNVLTVGYNGPNDNIAGAADISEGAAAYALVTTGNTLTPSTDQTVYVKYTQTGGAATAGKACLILAFVPNNDL